MGLAGVVLGAGYLWFLATQIQASQARYQLYGPSFFPRVVLVLFIGLAVLQLIRGFVRAGRQGQQAASPTAQRWHWMDLLAACLLVCGFAVMLKLTGFLPATFLFQVAILALVFRQRSPKLVIGVPLLLTTIYFVLFVRLMQMPLPQGQGIFREFSRIVYY